MDIQGTITIERPIGEVWAFLQDLRNDFAWQADLLRETVLYNSPTGVGTKVRETRKGFGESTWEVTEVIPMRRVAYKSISSPIPYEGVYLFEEAAGATKFTLGLTSSCAVFRSLLRSSQGLPQRSSSRRTCKNMLEM
ncbi:MAG: SRPBCC family protein [Coriobacteriia bacterium]|nr:SRPBCC family protein [Coriobacteriia bacterium]